MGSEVNGECKRKRKNCSISNGQEDLLIKKTKILNASNCSVPDEAKIPRLSVPFSSIQNPISIEQVSELLQFAALGKLHGAKKPSWCRLHHQRKLTGVNVIIVQGVSQLHFYRYFLHFKNIRRIYSHKFSLSTLPPPDDFLCRILNMRFEETKTPTDIETHFSKETSSHSSKHVSAASALDLNVDPIIKRYGAEKGGLTKYLLSKKEMKKNDYPMDGYPDYKDYVTTNCTGPVTDDSPLFGLDCEMCATDKGMKLTRVSLVDNNGQCIMDELVKPKEKIVDYLTKFSGVTEALLEPITTTLQDVQKQLKKLLPSNAVLVGHSLNFDLQALEMTHPYILDTSLLFIRNFGRKFKLKFLAGAVLGWRIQCEARTGHDPCEDAMAALGLAQYFIREGPKKVAELMLDDLLRKYQNSEHDPSFVYTEAVQPEVFSRHQKTLDNGLESNSLLDSLHKVNLPGIYIVKKGHGNKLPCQEGKLDRIECTSEKEVLQEAMKEIPSRFFSIVNFSSYEKSQQMMVDKVAQMCTVYAGPFGKDFEMKHVKKLFLSCGPITSINIIHGTLMPFVCVEYEVLEGAHLAMEFLNGYELDGSTIKVVRPVTTATLDYDLVLKELESEARNENVIFVSGVSKKLTESDLHHKFSTFGQIEGVFLPRDQLTGKHRKYGLIKYQTALGSTSALSSEVFLHKRKIKKCWAYTPFYLHTWTNHNSHDTLQISSTTRTLLPNVISRFNDQKLHLEENIPRQMKKIDKKVGKIFKSLPIKTFCLLLFPGHDRSNGSLPGLCMTSIKRFPSNALGTS
ncbi:RNA exonuclease 5-like [Polypterus senegalus]|uniref:RNA exonuclease 5-like n=1 Tax=Polypterus senegalus TaxID=55291 RepID=UPI0019652330|nr:RNA exonuclease 5-like [Polypterus senegalus]